MFAAPHLELLRHLNVEGQVDWTTAVIDGNHIRALQGGDIDRGPSPVDRARTSSKHHLPTDSTVIPLAISLTGGHRSVDEGWVR